jgi:hypothetical protein
MRPHFVRRLTIIFAALTLIAQGGYGRCGDDPKADDEDKKPTSWPPPMSARTARTWITLHETTIRPLPDRTPLRKVIQALREATRGKDGKGPEVDFRFKELVLEEAELSQVTLDTPILSPFVGQPEISVDTYLKYVLRQFLWERYVHDGFVLIDSPCDDCEGYATVSVTEAHAWLLLHQIVPVKFPEKATLGEVLKAITEATKGRGLNGRGLVIATARSAWNDRADWSKPVAIVDQDAPIGTLLDRMLRPLDLGFRVLSDGNILIVAAARTRREAGETNEAFRGVSDWENDFPMYRSTYHVMWRDMVEAFLGKDRSRRGKDLEQAAPAQP